ncbi:hypothetical protein BU15DRAFT_47513 [Melanogaster broomeanus]|nr:hypothetical protein BU15DRAFT_47513 [Melanogaster broomeanus]
MVFYTSLYLFILLSVVHASSWFSSEPEYSKWSQHELCTWLENHNIRVPSHFDKTHIYDLVDANWASPRPSSHAEAGHQWNAYYSSIASASASSVYAGATDTADSASQTVSNVAAQAVSGVTRVFDDSKDYVYSTWDDNRLRSWLEDHGIVEARTASTREELTDLANDFYRTASEPLWERWSDSYIRDWLIAHNLLKSSDAASRSGLIGEMDKYYYNTSDKVWNTWSDSELKTWLVEHGFLKSDAQKQREELVKMVEDHYLSASDSVWGAWSDSDIRQWLLEHGYLDDRSEAKKKRDELVKLIHSKYTDASAKTASYLVWPDARLRTYLRERGVSESALPSSRPGLLQETRIRWVQAYTRAETIFAKLKEIVNTSVEVAEEKLSRVLEVYLIVLFARAFRITGDFYNRF